MLAKLNFSAVARCRAHLALGCFLTKRGAKVVSVAQIECARVTLRRVQKCVYFEEQISTRSVEEAQAEHALPVYALAKDTLPRSVWVGIEKIIAQTMHESEKTNSSSLKAKQRKTPALKE